MILEDKIENKATLSAGITDIGEFSIKNSAKAFHILSTSLYSDPTLAILRELGCNARDSHLAAGQTKPWCIHFPTVVEPYLEIEDFGLGLSHEEVMSIFTTFFESTKTDSNDFVGALGLGSKSPFSYTDNFSVVAIKNGEKNVYSAYKTDEGFPAIARLNTEPTDLGNGVAIRLAIKTGDIDKFVSRRTVFGFFDQLPDSNIKLEKNIPTKVDVGSLSVETFSTYGSAAPIVIMGGIKYPIDVNRPEFEKFKDTLRCNVILRAGIGDVDMQPSREGLTYSKKTIYWIITHINKLELSIKAEIKKIIKGIESPWDKYAAVMKFLSINLCKQFVLGYDKEYRQGLQIGFDIDTTNEHNIKIRTRADSYNIKFKLQKSEFVIEPPNNTIYRYERSFAYEAPEIYFDDVGLSVTEYANQNIQYSRSKTIAIISTKPKSRKTVLNLLEAKCAAVGVELRLASNHFKRDVKTAKKPKLTHSVPAFVDSRSRWNNTTVLTFTSSSDSLSPSVKYWVPIDRGSLDIPEFHQEYRAVRDFIQTNPKSVVGLNKIQRGKTNLIDLRALITEEFRKDEEWIEQNKLISAIYVYTMTHQPNYSNFEIDQFTDPILKQIACGVTVNIKHQTNAITALRHSKEFTEISGHVDKFYPYGIFSYLSSMNITKSARTQIINSIYEVTSKEITS